MIIPLAYQVKVSAVRVVKPVQEEDNDFFLRDLVYAIAQIQLFFVHRIDVPNVGHQRKDLVLREQRSLLRLLRVNQDALALLLKSI